MKLDTKQRNAIETAFNDWARRMPAEIDGRWKDHVNLDNMPRAIIDVLEELPPNYVMIEALSPVL